MGHYLDHHSAVLDALKNQDLNTLKLLINKDKKASVYHACLALTNSNPEIFKHMLENSLEPASTVELLLNMLDSLYEQELKNIPDETLEFLFDSTIKYHGNPRVILNRALNTQRHSLLRNILKKHKGKSLDPNDMLLAALLTNNFQTVYDCTVLGADITFKNSRAIAVATGISAYRMSWFVKALGADPIAAKKNISKDDFLTSINEALKASESKQVEESLEDFIAENNVLHTPQYNLDTSTLNDKPFAFLRTKSDIDNDTSLSLIHILTADQNFDFIVEKSITDNEDKLSLSDLLDMNKKTGLNVIETLTRQGQLKKLLNPELWIGRTRDLQTLIDVYIPKFAVEKYAYDFDMLVKMTQTLEKSRALKSNAVPKIKRRNR